MRQWAERPQVPAWSRVACGQRGRPGEAPVPGWQGRGAAGSSRSVPPGARRHPSRPSVPSGDDPGPHGRHHGEPHLLHLPGAHLPEGAPELALLPGEPPGRGRRGGPCGAAAAQGTGAGPAVPRPGVGQGVGPPSTAVEGTHSLSPGCSAATLWPGEVPGALRAVWSALAGSRVVRLALPCSGSHVLADFPSRFSSWGRSAPPVVGDSPSPAFICGCYEGRTGGRGYILLKGPFLSGCPLLWKRFSRWRRAALPAPCSRPSVAWVCSGTVRFSQPIPPGLSLEGVSLTTAYGWLLSGFVLSGLLIGVFKTTYS